MNTNAILAVADAIETGSVPGLGFNMQFPMQVRAPDYGDYPGGRENCGCIEVWAKAITGVSSLSDAFGIESQEASDLAMPEGYSRRPEDYPASAAVSVLRHLAATGEVDWPRALASKMEEQTV